jgi:hypothetical protein
MTVMQLTMYCPHAALELPYSAQHRLWPLCKPRNNIFYWVLIRKQIMIPMRGGVRGAWEGRICNWPLLPIITIITYYYMFETEQLADESEMIMIPSCASFVPNTSSSKSWGPQMVWNWSEKNGLKLRKNEKMVWLREKNGLKSSKWSEIEQMVWNRGNGLKSRKCSRHLLPAFWRPWQGYFSTITHWQKAFQAKFQSRHFY